MNPSDTSYMRLPAPPLLFFASIAVLGTLTANPLLTVASVLVLPLFIRLLWRQDEPPVLLFAISFQWAQVTAKVFHADYLGLDIAALSRSSHVVQAVWLGLVGLVVLAVGMRLGMNRLGLLDTERLRRQLRRLSTDRVFMLYLAVTLLDGLVARFAWLVPGLTQILLAATSMRWVFFFLLGYLVLQRKENRYFFIIAALIEFVAGIGYFSGFKTVLFVAAIVVLAVRPRLNLRTASLGVALAALLVVLGAGWMSIRGQYRGYLNQGTGGQVVRVSRTQQLTKLATLAGEVRADDLAASIEPMFERLAYVDFFAAVIDHVPERRPHENGALWGQSVQHILMPRLLFPNKPVLPSDSERTMKYTGLTVASGAQGTSVSMGYMAESYIDFGPYGMFLPIFLIGLLWGFMYYYFVSRARLLVVGYAFATALLIHANQFEVTSLKLLGSVVMKFIVLALLLRFAMPVLNRWMQRAPAPQAAE
jgi:hypothetical protein